MTARQPHPQRCEKLDGEAIFADLVSAEKEASDLRELEIKIQVLIAGIGNGKYARHSSSPAPVPKSKSGIDCDDCMFAKECTQTAYLPPCSNRSALKEQQAAEAARREVLDALKNFIRGNSETIEADDGTLEDAVFCGDLFAWIERQESLRRGEGV